MTGRRGEKGKKDLPAHFLNMPIRRALGWEYLIINQDRPAIFHHRDDVPQDLDAVGVGPVVED